MVDKVHFSSKRDDWQTPDEIIAAVLRAMGEIDLDPCSNSHEEPNIPAKTHYTKEDDGLANPWYGRVYLNMPYGRGPNGILPWCRKLHEEVVAGRVEKALALVPARPGSFWWRTLSIKATCIVLVDGRLKFKGAPTGAPFPSAIFAYGISPRTVKRAFYGLGMTWGPV